MDFDALERLGRLRDTGAITPEEFEAEKRKILGTATAAVESPEAPGEGTQPTISSSTTIILLFAALAIGFGSFIAFKLLTTRSNSADVIVASLDESTASEAEAEPAFKVSSSIGSLKIAATTALPVNPDKTPFDDYCSEYVADPKTQSAKHVAEKGWRVTGEAKLDELDAVSFAGGVEPGTSGICYLKNGNVAIFQDGQLQAILYGKEVGSVASIPNSKAVRLWSDDGIIPIADVSHSARVISVHRLATTDLVCASRIPLPSPFGLPVSAARAKLIESGWKPLPQFENLGMNSRVEEMRKLGINEVESCAGTGTAGCYFVYAKDGADLALRSFGEDEDPVIVSYDVTC